MTDDIKKRALHRSKIIQGQVKGLEKQIEDDEYCIAILTQSLAVQKSLASLDKLLLERHMRTHVIDQIASGGPAVQSKAIEELIGLYELRVVRGK